MEVSAFDHLLCRAGEQTTRREALGALVGGALLLNSRGDSEASKKGERRKKRKRRQYQQQMSDPALLTVVNPGQSRSPCNSWVLTTRSFSGIANLWG